MTAEREFAGFVLPFAAGTFLATGIGFTSMAQQPATAGIPLIMSAIFLLLFMQQRRKDAAPVFSWIMLICLGIAAGAFAGMNSSLLDISSPASRIMNRTSAFGHSLGEAIDSLSFRHNETNALLKALITGERNDIPREITAAFRDSGAAHILSLSGFHLGIIYAIVRWSLSWIGNSLNSRLIRSTLIILLCGFYTLATGAGPSIVRSFLFILLGELALLTQRRRTTSSVLLAAMLIQLAVSPSEIRSVSFQLSYAAMAGIAFIYPKLRDFWPGMASEDRAPIRFVRWIWNSASMSIACQLTTAPLAWFYFETFPQHFLLTNLIALPLTTLLIPLGLLSLFLSILSLCPSLLLHITDSISQALSYSLSIIAGM